MKGKIFTAQEMQSILDGSKRMFREVVAKRTWFGEFLQTLEGGSLTNVEEFIKDFCPYQIGDLVFVKESFTLDPRGGFNYKSGFPDNIPEEYAPDWTSAQHMKQHQSRITLRIKDISVERENDLWFWIINFEIVNK